MIYILAVVVTVLRGKSGLVSAMYTGKKIFSKKSVDLDDNLN